MNSTVRAFWKGFPGIGAAVATPETVLFSKTTLWFTGLSGAGKTTLAKELERKLAQRGYKTVLLDGDSLRRGLNSDLGFSAEDRMENIRRFGEVAALFRRAAVLNLVSVISPFEKDRRAARSIAGADETFIEIFVDCPLHECRKRDPKGLYRRALAGEIPDFTGISSPYEPPTDPDIHIRTDLLSVVEAVEKIEWKLERLKVLC